MTGMWPFERDGNGGDPPAEPPPEPFETESIEEGDTADE